MSPLGLWLFCTAITVRLVIGDVPDNGNIKNSSVTNSVGIRIGNVKWRNAGKADGSGIKVEMSGKNPTSGTPPWSDAMKKTSDVQKRAAKVNIANESYGGNGDDISRLSEQSSPPPLPEVDVSHVTLFKDEEGYDVHVEWTRPKQKSNFTWIYGVFYGINEEDMLSYPRDETTNTSVMVKNLGFCQKYIFTVAIIGPIGVGPFSKNYCYVNVPMDDKAPPEKLDVEFEPGELPKVLIQWSASCPAVLRPIGYNVMVFDRHNSEITITTISPTTDYELQFRFMASFGDVFDIKVSTDRVGAKYTPPITFEVPFYLQPYKVKVTRAANDTFIVYWREPYVPKSVGHYRYEILVSTDESLNETLAETHQVMKPVFVYSGNDGEEYSFWVKLVTNMGYNSLASKAVYVNSDE